MDRSPSAPVATVDDGYVRLAGFGAALRAAGVPVSPARMVEFCRAATLTGVDELYWTGRITLVSSPAEAATYDRVFAEYFGQSRPTPPPPATIEIEQARLTGEEAEPEPGAEPEGVASPEELWRHKDFASYSEAELARLAAVLAAMRLPVPARRTRRWRPARRGRPDPRRTVREAFRMAGDPAIRRYRARRTRPRRLVFILDVSHSMSDYARALLMVAHAGLRTPGQVEVFCFGTRLTRLTAALARTSVDDVLARAADEILDWDGGTRIGESLARFLSAYGHAGMARGAVVVICSDGLDTGDPRLLGEQMARLSRLAHRTVWLNPLRADPRYEPRARGMRAALPYVDVFASGHDLADLETVAGLLAEHAGGSGAGHRPRVAMS